MKLIGTRRLEGANGWFGGRTLEAVVDNVPEWPVAGLDLSAWEGPFRLLPPALGGLPGCLRRAAGSAAGWAPLVADLAGAFQATARGYAGRCEARREAGPRAWVLALECPEFAFAEACLRAALRMAGWLREGADGGLAGLVEGLADAAYRECLGGSSWPIVEAARRRGIPAYRLDRESLVQLGEGVHQRRICAAVTSRTNQIAYALSEDKAMVKALWERIGIPTAAGRVVVDEDDAVLAARELGGPVVVKPGDASYQRGVSLNLTGEDRIRRGYALARAESARGQVLVERFLRGEWHRLLVVAGRLVATVRCEPLHVVGDGRLSVRDLATRVGRGPGDLGEEWRSDLITYELETLEAAGLTPETVPGPGERVVLQPGVYAYEDVTGRVHPATTGLAVEATRLIGLDVAGLDVVAEDIGRPLAEQGGGFLEINAEPAIALHLRPWLGSPRPVDEAIVESLFPGPSDGRIPLLVALGGDVADAAARRMATSLRRSGRAAALATPAAVEWWEGRSAPAQDGPAGRLSAAMLHPLTEAAVMVAGLSEVAREGLGAERCHVLMLAGGDRGGEGSSVDRRKARALVRRLVEASGRCVVDVEDPFWEEAASSSVPIVAVSTDPGHPEILRRRGAGEPAVFARGPEIVLCDGDAEVARVPASCGPPGEGEPAVPIGATAMAVAGLWARGNSPRPAPPAGPR